MSLCPTRGPDGISARSESEAMLTKDGTIADARDADTGKPFRAMFKADWVEAVFIHYAVAPEALRPYVPFELDTFEGLAYVSLVAFTQRRLRPTIGGRLAEVLSKPLACHEFLNVRTYVREGDERGIHFLAEWIPNRLAALIGPPMYGLPYRVGRLNYAHDPDAGTLRGAVAARGGRVEFEGMIDAPGNFHPAPPGMLDAFLVERYAAWTYRLGVARRFRIRHGPWLQCRARVAVCRADLLAGLCGGMFTRAVPALAHFSPGAFDVKISPPRRCGVGWARKRRIKAILPT